MNLHNFKVRLVATVAMLLSFACDQSNEPLSSEALDSNIESLTLTLSVIDTIGVFTGEDNYVFGDIGDASYSASGDILVLDQISSFVSFFSPTGEFITSVGGPGEAPWEFSYVTSFAPMDDGRLVVADYGGRKLVVFNDTLGYSSSLTGFPNTSPTMLKPLPDGTFIGRDSEYFQNADGSLSAENTIRRWSSDSSSSIVTYFSSPMFVTQEDGSIDIKPAAIVTTTSPDGSVYCAVSSDSAYQVFGYDTNGLLTLEIAESWEKIAKSDEVMEAQGTTTALQTDDSGNSRAVTIDVDVEPYYDAISSLNTDHEGRLWVRLGSEQIPTFRVYNHCGEFLFSAICPELEEFGNQIRFQMRNGGIVAWDNSPEDYAKVYLLELSEN